MRLFNVNNIPDDNTVLFYYFLNNGINNYTFKDIQYCHTHISNVLLPPLGSKFKAFNIWGY